MKNTDLQESTSFCDHVYLWCTQRECKLIETIFEEYAKMLESRISTGATAKLLSREKPHAKITAWYYDMEGHAQKYVERYNELISKKVK